MSSTPTATATKRPGCASTGRSTPATVPTCPRLSQHVVLDLPVSDGGNRRVLAVLAYLDRA